MAPFPASYVWLVCDFHHRLLQRSAGLTSMSRTCHYTLLSVHSLHCSLWTFLLTCLCTQGHLTSLLCLLCMHSCCMLVCSCQPCSHLRSSVCCLMVHVVFYSSPAGLPQGAALLTTVTTKAERGFVHVIRLVWKQGPSCSSMEIGCMVQCYRGSGFSCALFAMGL